MLIKGYWTSKDGAADELRKRGCNLFEKDGDFESTNIPDKWMEEEFEYTKGNLHCAGTLRYKG